MVQIFNVPLEGQACSLLIKDKDESDDPRLGPIEAINVSQRPCGRKQYVTKDKYRLARLSTWGVMATRIDMDDISITWVNNKHPTLNFLSSEAFYRG